MLSGTQISDSSLRRSLVDRSGVELLSVSSRGHSLASLPGLIPDLFLSQRQLLLDTLALRHQLGVLRRSVRRPKLTNADRLFWVLLARSNRRWSRCLVILSPATVLDRRRRSHPRHP